MAKSSLASCSSICETISKQDLDRWTGGVHYVLDSPRARKKFQGFLSRKRMENAEITVKFWEKCNFLLIEAQQNEHLKSSIKLNPNQISHGRFRKNYEKMVEYAEEYINFDANQLRILRQALNEGNIAKMVKIMNEALNFVALLLHDDYNMFKKELINEIKSQKQKQK